MVVGRHALPHRVLASFCRDAAVNPLSVVMPSVSSMLAADAQEVHAPSDEQMSTIKNLIELQRFLARCIEEKEEQLEDLEKRHAKVSQVDLPRAMESAGMTSFTMSDGNVVEVGTSYFAGITDGKREQAYAWLRAHRHDDLIKNTLTVTLERGQDALAAEVAEFLKLRKLDYEQRQTVHGSTLKAFVREQYEKGKPLDKDLLGVHVVTAAEVKGPSAKKKRTKRKHTS